MTKIPESHLLGHKAVLEVCKILDDAGAISEQIKNDYGEDLIIQTHLKHNADNFHVLIQVKGRRLSPKNDGSYSIRVDVDHLRRWVSHVFSILVCIYEENTQTVYAFSPRDHFSLWELSTTKSKTLSVRLSKDHVFDPETAKVAIWNCRIEYYSRMIGWHENTIHHARQMEGIDNTEDHVNREMNIIVFNFLKDISIIENGGFSKKFIRFVKNASRNFSEENQTEVEKWNLEHAFSLAIMGTIDEVQRGVGLPANIIENSSRISMYLFEKMHGDIWKSLISKFPEANSH